MIKVTLYIAQSLDGFIADATGGIGWLAPFDNVDYGYEAFLAGIDGLVVGRSTFDQIPSLGPWSYGTRPVAVITSRPLDSGAPAMAAAVSADAEAALHSLAARGARSVWLMGGGRTIRPFVDADRIDRFMVFVIPVLLGRGLPLFPPGAPGPTLRLAAARAYPNGVVGLDYVRERTAT